MLERFPCYNLSHTNHIPEMNSPTFNVLIWDFIWFVNQQRMNLTVVGGDKMYVLDFAVNVYVRTFVYFMILKFRCSHNLMKTRGLHSLRQNRFVDLLI